MNATVNLSRFRKCCCYCYRDIAEGICVCGCGLSFCSAHKQIHFCKAGCFAVLEARDFGGERGIEVRSEVIDGDEMLDAVKKLKALAELNYFEGVTQENDEIMCVHGCSVNAGDLNVGEACKVECEMCSIRSRLWICISCGYVGCGRKQYGVEGEGHARMHYEKEGHNIFVLVESLGMKNVEVFCYLCDSRVMSEYDMFDRMVRIRFEDRDAADVINDVCVRIDYSGGMESSEKSRHGCDNEPAEEVNGPYVGIGNFGNTCYISSALQIVGYAVSHEDVDTEMHFEVCHAKNPLECLFCQLMRVFGTMRQSVKEGKGSRILIEELATLVWKAMPVFERHTQQDAHEFLVLLLEQIAEAESMYLIPQITSLLNFEICMRVECSGCSEVCVTHEKIPVVCTIMNDSISKAVDVFFDDDTWKCECGGDKRRKKRITRLPKYMAVQVGRYVYDSGELKKINYKIGIRSLVLEKHMSNAHADQALVADLVNCGYAAERARSALSTAENDMEIALQIMQADQECEVAKDHEYRVVGCISHTGCNPASGHYTWWVYSENGCKLIDDTKIVECSVEILEDGYIFLLR
ncbi:ubiquitin carboxyl-terminal hydrolase [Ordospora pajunii]|uniref:ubiquitin carboxyl-terminal hydrolase n=1 Tax=Ordospora pajunii TaxID=3039483 RepID=UPI002952880E|nr:ubiquitin carboxyl-terminal hydrolase [Ordospora pajunii]KAH9411793.1 ubiquitin carboxyl-terminal hydrolase [Ordospora pajunii]